MKFCPECGTRAEGFRFCPECGYKLTGGETATASAPKTDDIFGSAFGTDTFAKNDFLGDSGIDDFDWGGAAQARTRDVEAQQEADALAAFEWTKHQNGKYAILSLKDKMEMDVTVPAGVEAIENGAFEGSGVFRVELPEGLMKIGNRAFADCAELTDIVFPKSLRMIGNEAFAGCVNLDVEAPERARVGNDAFAGTLPDVRKRREAEEAERKRREAEEAERKHKAEFEKQRREWYETGKRYYNNEDYEEAAEYFLKAAEQGYAEAQYWLGECYSWGGGVDEDEAEAVKWYRKAAEQGYAKAQYELGYCYYYSHGVDEDEAEAVKWYRKAAEQGYAEAQYELGDCYYYGYGVDKDQAEGVKWYRKAAEQGYTKAQLDLGYCYYLGRGVEEDEVEGIKWYRKAAEQGDSSAQEWLKEHGY